jgi:hypothetical protein
MEKDDEDASIPFRGDSGGMGGDAIEDKDDMRLFLNEEEDATSLGVPPPFSINSSVLESLYMFLSVRPMRLHDGSESAPPAVVVLVVVVVAFAPAPVAAPPPPSPPGLQLLVKSPCRNETLLLLLLLLLRPRSFRSDFDFEIEEDEEDDRTIKSLMLLEVIRAASLGCCSVVVDAS